MSNQDDQTFTDETVTKRYTSRENEQIPVVEDSKYGAEGMDAMDDEVKDSDAQLSTPCFFPNLLIVAADDTEAVDKSNIIKGDRLRHAKPAAGKYQEKEEDDLPTEAQ